MEACPACGGELQQLGILGNTEYWRCRNCGATIKGEQV